LKKTLHIVFGREEEELLTEYGIEQRRRMNYLVRKAKRLYMRRFLSPDQLPKKLWRILGTVGVKETVSDNIIFTPEHLFCHAISDYAKR
jgi:hypothetical protein